MSRAALLFASASALVASPAAAQSLDATIDMVLARSPAVAAAKAREDGAAAAVEQARAERNPTADLQGQIGVGRIDPQGFFALPADNVTPRVAQVGAQWPLFTGGRIGAAVDQARGGLEAARLARRIAARDLRTEVISTYTTALSARERSRAYETMVGSMQELLRQARLMFEVGAATSTDVSEAEARLAEAEVGLAAAKGELAAATARLTQLAGQPIELFPNLPAPPETPETAAAAVDAAIAGNPEIEQARYAAKIASAGERAARSEYLPTVAAYADASSVRDQFFPGYKADSASVGLRAKWTFFSGGRVSSKVDRAAAEARAASLDVQEYEDQLRVAAIQRYSDFQTATAMLLAAEKRAEATQAALRSTRLEVKAGAKPQVALLDAEREAIEAESARIDAAGRRILAAHALRAIAGMDSEG